MTLVHITFDDSRRRFINSCIRRPLVAHLSAESTNSSTCAREPPLKPTYLNRVTDDSACRRLLASRVNEID